MDDRQPLAYFYTTVHVLNHKEYSGCYMHRDPISTVLPGQSPFYGFCTLLPQKKGGGGVVDVKCPGFQEIIKNTKLLRMRRNILTSPRLRKRNIYNVTTAISHLLTKK